MDIFIATIWGVMFLLTWPIWYPLAMISDWVCETELYDYLAENYNWKYFYRIPTLGQALEATQNSPRLIVRVLGWYFDRTVYYVSKISTKVKDAPTYQDFLDLYCL